MFKVIISPVAKQNIAEAAKWYNSQRNNLGKRFIKEVNSHILHIRQNPLATAIRYDDVRTAVLDIFPYLIHFFVDEELQIVVILTVLHTSRNPDIWKGYR